MTAEKEQAKQPEAVSSRSKVALLVLTGLFALLCLAGIIVMRVNKPLFVSEEADSLNASFYSFLSSLQTSDFSHSFQDRRVFPGGPGLAEWFESMPLAGQIKSISVSYEALYRFDPHEAWEAELREGTLRVRAPAPESLGIKISPTGMSLETAAPTSPEDQALFLEIVKEKSPPIIAAEEQQREKERFAVLKQNVAGIAAKWVEKSGRFASAPKVIVFFAGEESTATDEP